MPDVTSSNKAPPAAFKESALSKTATAFNPDNAFAISSDGKGLNTLIFKRPAFIPFFLNYLQRI